MYLAKHRESIIKLFKHHKIKGFDFDLYQAKQGINLKFVIPERTNLTVLQNISYLLGTDEIIIKSSEDRFREYIIEIEAKNIDLDNVKIQSVYMESK